MQYAMLVTMVISKRLEWLFVHQCCTEVMHGLTTGIIFSVAKNVLTSYAFLSARRIVRMLYEISRGSTTRLAMCVAVVVDVGAAHVDFS